MDRGYKRKRLGILLFLFACFALGAWYRVTYLSQGTQPESPARSSLSRPKTGAENKTNGSENSPLENDLNAANPDSIEEDLKKLEAEVRE